MARGDARCRRVSDFVNEALPHRWHQFIHDVNGSPTAAATIDLPQVTSLIARVACRRLAVPSHYPSDAVEDGISRPQDLSNRGFARGRDWPRYRQRHAADGERFVRAEPSRRSERLLAADAENELRFGDHDLLDAADRDHRRGILRLVPVHGVDRQTAVGEGWRFKLPSPRAIDEMCAGRYEGLEARRRRHRADLRRQCYERRPSLCGPIGIVNDEEYRLPGGRGGG